MRNKFNNGLLGALGTRFILHLKNIEMYSLKVGTGLTIIFQTQCFHVN